MSTRYYWSLDRDHRRGERIHWDGELGRQWARLANNGHGQSMFGNRVGNIDAQRARQQQSNPGDPYFDYHRHQRQFETFDNVDSQHPINAAVAVHRFIRPKKSGRIFRAFCGGGETESSEAPLCEAPLWVNS
jgi:hypothetical protein